MNTPKQRGRPRKALSDRRSVKLPVMVTSVELTQLQADARQQGMTLTEHVRAKIGLQ